jgi:hypothetical protein
MTAKNKHPVRFGDLDWYADEIIKCLELVVTKTGIALAQVCDDWLAVTAATLRALPEQIKAAGQTGEPGKDTLDAVEVFNIVSRRYARTYSGVPEDLWRLGFAKAFALLLEATEPGLWALDGLSNCVMGPDILAEIYTRTAVRNPKWNGTYFTPWALAVVAARIIAEGVEREVHDRIKKALLRPENHVGQMVLLGVFLNSSDRPDEFEEYFFNKILPSAAPFYEAVEFNEPAIGSGIMMLALAAQLPPWMAKMNFCRITGQDISFTCCLMSEISLMLYGLNGYGLRLNLAVAEAMAAYRQRTTTVMAPLKEVLRAVPVQPIPGHSSDGATFEKVFREAVVHLC